MNYHPQVRTDLKFVCRYFPTACLEHVVANRRRLIRRSYDDGQQGGCLFRLLSELLPPDRQIHSKDQLTFFFTGGTGAAARELPDYQPARWLVRAIDGDICSNVRARYGAEMTLLDWDFVVEVLQAEIERRRANTKSSAAQLVTPLSAVPVRPGGTAV